MSRKPRIHVVGGLYHVILRGNARQDVFLNAVDRIDWQSIIERTLADYEHRLHAFCWMRNHVHMALQAGTNPLGQAMSFLASQYARRFNRRHRRSGHLFERRYRAILVQEQNYLKELVRYIHMNPLRASVVDRLAEYRWSSHNLYLGAQKHDWLTQDYVLAMFGSTRRDAIKNYRAFMDEAASPACTDQLRRGSKTDDRLLGDDTWLTKILANESRSAAPQTLDEIVSTVCEAHNLDEKSLSLPRGSHLHSEIRAKIAIQAVDNGVASISEVARRFNRSQSALSQVMRRLRRKKNL